MRQTTAGMPAPSRGRAAAGQDFLPHRRGGVCHGNDMAHTLGLSLPMSAACPPRDPRFATTLAHGLALLEAFDATHAALTNKELAERSRLSKATVSRLSLTLQAHGLLECGPGERRHRLASAALTLGYPLLAGLGIRREARWGMKQLAGEVGGSGLLGLGEGGGGGGRVGRDIEHLQRHGFCVSHADWQSDVYAVAVPLNAPADAEPL